jgi:hypothetical protein
LRAMSERINERNKGTTVTFKDPEGRKQKIRNTKAAKPYTHTEEARDEMSTTRKGRKGSESQRQNVSKTWLVTIPEGIAITVTNLAQFCREYGLDKANITNKYGSKGYRAISAIT